MTLPELQNIRIFQSVGRITSKSIESCDQLLLILPARATARHLGSLPQGAKMQKMLRRHKGDAVPAFSTRMANSKQTLVVAGRLAADASSFDRLTLARKLVAAATTQKPGSLGIAAPGFDSPDAIVCDALAAALAAGFALPQFKQKPATSPIRSIRLLGLADRLDTHRVEAEAAGNNLARWLTTMPPNKMDAKGYAACAEALAKQHGWQYRHFDTRALKKLGAGAFLAVAQGNEDDSAGIVRLRYRPGATDDKAGLSLVGKGIVFDTGGNNLKPFESMLDMHGDMQGSAVALGALLALSLLKVPVAIDCWLALTENRIGPNAYKSQDVVTAANGKTIQAIHTDAEGRMALADTLVLASRDEPGLIMDFATLTGSCINAITTRYSGVFSNRAELHPLLKRTGRQSGERVWPFPIGKEFLTALDSPVADLKQCTRKGDGDHIVAASFLNEFVENDVPWIHMDLSASDNSAGLAHIASKFTGFGVRYAVSAMLDAGLYHDALEGKRAQ